MSDLVGNFEDRFSRVAAHLSHYGVHCFNISHVAKKRSWSFLSGKNVCNAD